jgi:hypothetical protein
VRDIIAYIDAQLHECFPDAQAFGICHLIEDDNAENYPSTLEEKAIAVYPNDKYEILYYHRLLDGSPEPDEDLSFGRKKTIVNSQAIRTVVFVRMKEDDLSFIEDFINALPETFELEESPVQYKKISLVREVNLIRDSNAIWEEEYSTSYKDKYQKVWNIYALEYRIQVAKCPVCVT